MDKRCRNCLKNDVCKYLEDFEKFVKEQEENISEEVDFAKVEISCKFKKVENYGTRDIVFPTNPQPTPIVPWDTQITYYGTTGDLDGDNINLG